MLQNKDGRGEGLMTTMVAPKIEASDSEGNVEEDESDSSSTRGRASKQQRLSATPNNNKKLRLKEEDGRKSIMVGGEFQASIPDGLCQYGDALPYENEDKLLWDPTYLSPRQIEDYLARIQMTPHINNNNNSKGVLELPQGLHTRDDEQALYTLLQCGYNMEEALRRVRLNPCPNDTMSLWSEEECSHFESGLRLHGKDFHLIQMNKVKTRSVAELVHFYYLWKKTERHDMFANKARLLKKKYGLLQGFNDYMDRFLDEQEGCPNRGENNSSPSNSMSA